MTKEKSVDQFNRDMKQGGYQYSKAKARLSSVMANKRLSDAVLGSIDLKGKRVIDLGCGDGTYTREFLSQNPAYVLGIDAADEAIKFANERFSSAQMGFKTMDIYEIASLKEHFDVAVIRGLLHHLYEPDRLIKLLAGVTREVIIIEPNGYNPFLKIIEKCSSYHVLHEEKSYFPFKLRQWFVRDGGCCVSYRYCGLVPFFCPDPLAMFLKKLEPFVEALPLVRETCCAVIIMRFTYSPRGGNV